MDMPTSYELHTMPGNADLWHEVAIDWQDQVWRERFRARVLAQRTFLVGVLTGAALLWLWI